MSYQKSKTKICPICGKEFYYKHINNKCCSRECGMKTRKGKSALKKQDYPCVICGKIKKLTPYKASKVKHIHCSIECRNIGCSERMSGKGNPMYGKTHTPEVKKKLAKLAMGRFNGNTKAGKREDIDHHFRSSWEANYARLLNSKGIKWEYEPKTFYFEGIKRGSTSYTPDFYLPETDKWKEIKGWMTKKSKTKLKRFKKYYPEEEKKLELIDKHKWKEIDKEYNNIIPNWECMIDKEQTRKNALKYKYKKDFEKKEEIIEEAINMLESQGWCIVGFVYSKIYDLFAVHKTQGVLLLKVSHNNKKYDTPFLDFAKKYCREKIILKQMIKIDKNGWKIIDYNKKLKESENNG